MATVTGYTAAHMEVIKNSTVISGEVDSNGDLILTTRGGSSFNAGHVKGVDFDIGSVPNASESSIGVVRLATAIETSAGTRNDLAVSPKHLMSIADLKAELNHTHTVSQITDYVSQTQYMINEAMNGVPPAGEDVPGTVMLATPAETITGTDTEKATTPAGVRAAIENLAPADHSHTTSDITDYTTATQGMIDTSIAAIPQNPASTTQQGFVRFATYAETDAGTSESLAVTPKSLSDLYATWTAHTEALDDIAALQTGKANTSHTHSWAEISVTEADMPRIRLTSTGDVGLTSTGHALQIGPSNGQNLAMDPNEIMARNNGATSSLYINADGGYVEVGGPFGVNENLTVNGNSIYFPNHQTASSKAAVGSTWRLAGIASSNGLVASINSALDVSYIPHFTYASSNIYISSHPSVNASGTYMALSPTSGNAMWINSEYANDVNLMVLSQSGIPLFSGVYNNTITSTRRATWMDTSGWLGWASSSRTTKHDLGPALLDMGALRQIPIHHYHYLAELDKRKENPDHRVPTEIGTFAEDVHALGLWQFVQYEGHGEEAVPVGIHYEMLSLAALSLAQQLADENDQLKSRLDNIESRLIAAGI